MSDSLQVDALASQLKSNPKTQDIGSNQQMIQTAWDGAKTMARQSGVAPTDPNYWNLVSQQTKQSMGIFPTPDQQQPKTGEGSNFGFKPEAPQAKVTGPAGEPRPVFEDYSPHSKALPKTKPEEPQYAGLSKEEMAKQLIKKLRADGRSDNEITNSLVNRMLFDFKTASDLVGLKATNKVDPKDPFTPIDPSQQTVIESWHHKQNRASDFRGKRDNDEGEETYIPPKKKAPPKKAPVSPAKVVGTVEKKQEASAYDRGGILFQPGNPVEPTGTRDPFEWELSSTKYLAKALIFVRQKQFEVRFEVLSTQTMKWPMEWKFLKPHGVVSALRITVNQLSANPNGMTTSSISNAIDPSSVDDLVKTMGKVMKSYIQIWKKTNYQIVVMSTTTTQNLVFLMKLGKELAKIQSFKIDPNLSAEFSDPYINLAQTKGLYVVLKNSAGPAFKEGKLREIMWDEEVISAAFAATPENGGVKGKTGPEINAEAKRHLDQMKKGFNTQLESRRK